MSLSGSPRCISARGVSRRFGVKTALAPTDLDVGPGGITGLLGPNGSGKSTLLRILVGLVRPDAGEASIDGVPLAGDGTAVRRRVAYAPGELHLYGELSGREHLAFLLRGRPRPALERARAIAGDLGLPLHDRVRTYSHGMKRQLMLAAALAPELPVRLLDEPTDGLDPTKRAQVIGLLRADSARGTTIFLSSHHLVEVDLLCDRLVFLHEGEKLAEETSEGVFSRARRLVRLGYPSSVDVSAIGVEIARHTRASVRVDGKHLTAELVTDDPREFLAELGALSSVPAPERIEYGEISLQELYRELYGVEGY